MDPTQLLTNYVSFFEQRTETDLVDFLISLKSITVDINKNFPGRGAFYHRFDFDANGYLLFESANRDDLTEPLNRADGSRVLWSGSLKILVEIILEHYFANTGTASFETFFTDHEGRLLPLP